VLEHAYSTLGEMLSPYFGAFRPEVLVVGGGISAAWPLVEPPLRAGLGDVRLPIVQSADTEVSALRGAALCVDRRDGRCVDVLESGSYGLDPNEESD
jgi:glucokinase